MVHEVNGDIAAGWELRLSLTSALSPTHPPLSYLSDGSHFRLVGLSLADCVLSFVRRTVFRPQVKIAVDGPLACSIRLP